jgi:hypothetical protein
MLLAIARFFKTLFIKLALAEIKSQAKKIRKSNEKVSAAYEAAERYANDQESKRDASAGQIDNANTLLKE